MRTKNSKTSAEIMLEEVVGPLTLAGLLEAIREGEEWTKRDMAERLDVSPSYYSDLVAEKKSVSPKLAAQWAKLLQQSQQQFVRLAVQDQLKRAQLRYDVELRASV